MAKAINLKLYRELHSAFKAVNQGLTHSECDVRVGKLWKVFKESEEFPDNVKENIKDLKLQFEKRKSTLDKFWGTLPKKTKEPENAEPEVIPLVVATPPKERPAETRDKLFENELPNTPKQDEVTAKIVSLSLDITYLKNKKDNKKSLATEDELNRLKDLLSQRGLLEKKLVRLKGNQASAQRKRANEKSVLSQLQETNPEAAALLKKRSTPGRPRVEEQQPALLETMVDIAMYGASADEKRRTETIRTIKTLEQLLKELVTLGYQISRNAQYLRLLPKHPNSTEVKRHVVTVPVRLQRATYDFHKHHIDTSFCKASIRYLEELASILGPKEVLFISQDDKARVPIGKTAANKEAPMLMYVEYRVRLPDHDWVVADRHKLIPSVYALVQISENKVCDPTAVGYSGPTFICIRSGKHSSSTAFSHAKDLRDLLENQNLLEHCRLDDGKVKPVMMIIVDGGPDENPRYEKVQQAAIHHFRKHDLDAIFIATNAPGRSAFNRVERRMAPLSNELSGLILPHDKFGSHLNEQCKTVDAELELRNFQHAGEVLAEIWNGVKIDGFDTIAKYIPPEDSVEDISMNTDSKWRAVHVREGHYFFQVIKCADENCCSQFRGNLRKIIPTFIPGPMRIDQTGGVHLSDSSGDCAFSPLLLRLQLGDQKHRQGAIQEVSFDHCCPSVQELILARVCKYCSLYHGSVKTLKCHLKICQNRGAGVQVPDNLPSLVQSRRNGRPVRVAAKRQRELMICWTSRLNDEHADWFDEEELTGVEIQEDSRGADNTQVPVFDVNEYMKSVWEEVV